MLRIGAGKERVQRPDAPDVLFQQVRGQAGYIGDCVERIDTFRNGELEELSQGLPWPPSISAAVRVWLIAWGSGIGRFNVEAVADVPLFHC